MAENTQKRFGKMKTTKFLCIWTLVLLGLVAVSLPSNAQEDAKKKKARKAVANSRNFNFNLKYLRKNKDSGDDDLDFDVGGTGKNFMLVLAVDRYKYWKSLKNPVKDANDVKSILMKRYGFAQDNVYELYNEDVNLDKVQQVFAKLKQKGSGVDNLFIYYSGHGYYDASFDEGYWVPSEGKIGKTASYIPNTKIKQYIKGLNHRHVFLVADACFSGSLFSEAHRGYIEKVEQVKSRWGLTSGNLEYVSDGKAGQNSPFASYLIKFLKDNLKDKFAVSELIQYVTVAVADNTEQHPIGNPLKGVGNEGGQFVFRLK